MENKISYFDGLRVIACLMVITIHVFEVLLWNYSSMSASTKVIDAVFVGISRAGVGLFFMISGALMISNDKNASIPYVFKYRFLKIIKLIVISKAIYLLLGTLIYHDKAFSLVDLINGFTNNDDIYGTGALWFLYVLAGLYLCLPILVVLKNKAEKYLVYLVVLVLLNVYLRELLGYLFGIKFIFEVPMATSFLGIFVLGYLLNKVKLSEKMSALIIGVGFLAMLTIIVVTYQKSTAANKLNTELWNDLNLLTLLMCSGIFVFAKNSKIFNAFSKQSLICYLSSLTLIVYIIHYFVLKFNLRKAFNWDIFDMHTKHFMVLWVLTVVISFMIAFITTKLIQLTKRTT